MNELNSVVTGFLASLRNQSLSGKNVNASFGNHLVACTAGSIARWSIDGKRVKNARAVYLILAKAGAV